VWYVGGALHSNSKEQTTVKEFGSLRYLRPLSMRMEWVVGHPRTGSGKSGNRKLILGNAKVEKKRFDM